MRPYMVRPCQQKRLNPRDHRCACGHSRVYPNRPRQLKKVGKLMQANTLHSERNALQRMFDKSRLRNVMAQEARNPLWSERCSTSVLTEIATTAVFQRRGGVSSHEGCLQTVNNCLFFAAALFTGAKAEPFQYNEVITAPAKPKPPFHGLDRAVPQERGERLVAVATRYL